MDIKSAAKAHSSDNRLDSTTLYTEYSEPNATGSKSNNTDGLSRSVSRISSAKSDGSEERPTERLVISRSSSETYENYDETTSNSTSRGRTKERKNYPGRQYDRDQPKSTVGFPRYDQATRYSGDEDNDNDYDFSKPKSQVFSRNKLPAKNWGFSRSPSPHQSHSRSSSRSSSSSSSSSGSHSRAQSRSSSNQRHPSIASKVDRGDKNDGPGFLGIQIRGLPKRSTDSSIRDGLFHEFKKFGKVTAVSVQGQHEDRLAIVTFKKVEDAAKAREVSQGKRFFGSVIKVAPHEGIEPEDSEFRPPEAELDEFHPKATRTLFVGNLEKDISPQELQAIFKEFGEIIDIDIKRQGAVSAYAFVQYTDIASVVKALRKMDGENIGANKVKVKLGFGKSMPTNCVWIDGITEAVAEKFLLRHFGRHGHVTDCLIDRVRQKAMVFYDSVEFAQYALSEMRGRVFGGKRIQIDFASRDCQNNFFDKMERTRQLRPGERPDERGTPQKFNRGSYDSGTNKTTFERGINTNFRNFENRSSGHGATNFNRGGQSGSTSASFRRNNRQFSYDGAAAGNYDSDFSEVSNSRRRRPAEEYNQESGGGGTFNDDYEQELREYVGYAQRERREFESPSPTRGEQREDSPFGSREYEERYQDRYSDRYDSQGEAESIRSIGGTKREVRDKKYLADRRQSHVSPDSENESLKYRSEEEPSAERRKEKRRIRGSPMVEDTGSLRARSPGMEIEDMDYNTYKELRKREKYGEELRTKVKSRDSSSEFGVRTRKPTQVSDSSSSDNSDTEISGKREKGAHRHKDKENWKLPRQLSTRSDTSAGSRVRSRDLEPMDYEYDKSKLTRVDKLKYRAEDNIPEGKFSSPSPPSDQLESSDPDMLTEHQDSNRNYQNSEIFRLQQEKVDLLLLLKELEPHEPPSSSEESPPEAGEIGRTSKRSRMDVEVEIAKLRNEDSELYRTDPGQSCRKQMEMRRQIEEDIVMLREKVRRLQRDQEREEGEADSMSDSEATKEIPSEFPGKKRRKLNDESADHKRKRSYRKKSVSEGNLEINVDERAKCDTHESENPLKSPGSEIRSGELRIEVSEDGEVIRQSSVWRDRSPSRVMDMRAYRERYDIPKKDISLPLPRFALSFMSSSPRPGSPRGSGPSPMMSPAGTMKSPPFSPSGVSPQISPAVRRQSMDKNAVDKPNMSPPENKNKKRVEPLNIRKSDILSDDSLSPKSPKELSLEERIRALDEKLSRVETARTPTISDPTSVTIDYQKYKIRKRQDPSGILNASADKKNEPSAISKTLLSRTSILDQDSKRLELISGKYEPAVDLEDIAGKRLNNSSDFLPKKDPRIQQQQQDPRFHPHDPRVLSTNIPNSSVITSPVYSQTSFISSSASASLPTVPSSGQTSPFQKPNPVTVFNNSISNSLPNSDISPLSIKKDLQQSPVLKFDSNPPLLSPYPLKLDPDLMKDILEPKKSDSEPPPVLIPEVKPEPEVLMPSKEDLLILDVKPEEKDPFPAMPILKKEEPPVVAMEVDSNSLPVKTDVKKPEPEVKSILKKSDSTGANNKRKSEDHGIDEPKSKTPRSEVPDLSPAPVIPVSILKKESSPISSAKIEKSDKPEVNHDAKKSEGEVKKTKSSSSSSHSSSSHSDKNKEKKDSSSSKTKEKEKDKSSHKNSKTPEKVKSKDNKTKENGEKKAESSSKSVDKEKKEKEKSVEKIKEKDKSKDKVKDKSDKISSSSDKSKSENKVKDVKSESTSKNKEDKPKTDKKHDKSKGEEKKHSSSSTSSSSSDKLPRTEEKKSEHSEKVKEKKEHKSEKKEHKSGDGKDKEKKKEVKKEDSPCKDDSSDSKKSSSKSPDDKDRVKSHEKKKKKEEKSSNDKKKEGDKEKKEKKPKDERCKEKEFENKSPKDKDGDRDSQGKDLGGFSEGSKDKSETKVKENDTGGDDKSKPKENSTNKGTEDREEKKKVKKEKERDPEKKDKEPKKRDEVREPKKKSKDKEIKKRDRDEEPKKKERVSVGEETKKKDQNEESPKKDAEEFDWSMWMANDEPQYLSMYDKIKRRSNKQETTEKVVTPKSFDKLKHSRKKNRKGGFDTDDSLLTSDDDSSEEDTPVKKPGSAKKKTPSHQVKTPPTPRSSSKKKKIWTSSSSDDDMDSFLQKEKKTPKKQEKKRPEIIWSSSDSDSDLDLQITTTHKNNVHKKKDSPKSILEKMEESFRNESHKHSDKHSSDKHKKPKNKVKKSNSTENNIFDKTLFENKKNKEDSRRKSEDSSHVRKPSGDSHKKKDSFDDQHHKKKDTNHLKSPKIDSETKFEMLMKNELSVKIPENRLGNDLLSPKLLLSPKHSPIKGELNDKYNLLSPKLSPRFAMDKLMDTFKNNLNHKEIYNVADGSFLEDKHHEKRKKEKKKKHDRKSKDEKISNIFDEKPIHKNIFDNDLPSLVSKPEPKSTSRVIPDPEPVNTNSLSFFNIDMSNSDTNDDSGLAPTIDEIIIRTRDNDENDSSSVSGFPHFDNENDNDSLPYEIEEVPSRKRIESEDKEIDLNSFINNPPEIPEIDNTPEIETPPEIENLPEIENAINESTQEKIRIKHKKKSHSSDKDRDDDDDTRRKHKKKKHSKKSKHRDESTGHREESSGDEMNHELVIETEVPVAVAVTVPVPVEAELELPKLTNNISTQEDIEETVISDFNESGSIIESEVITEDMTHLNHDDDVPDEPKTVVDPVLDKLLLQERQSAEAAAAVSALQFTYNVDTEEVSNHSLELLHVTDDVVKPTEILLDLPLVTIDADAAAEIDAAVSALEGFGSIETEPKVEAFEDPTATVVPPPESEADLAVSALGDINPPGAFSEVFSPPPIKLEEKVHEEPEHHAVPEPDIKSPKPTIELKLDSESDVDTTPSISAPIPESSETLTEPEKEVVKEVVKPLILKIEHPVIQIPEMERNILIEKSVPVIEKRTPEIESVAVEPAPVLNTFHDSEPDESGMIIDTEPEVTKKSRKKKSKSRRRDSKLSIPESIGSSSHDIDTDVEAHPAKPVEEVKVVMPELVAKEAKIPLNLDDTFEEVLHGEHSGEPLSMTTGTPQKEEQSNAETTTYESNDDEGKLLIVEETNEKTPRRRTKRNRKSLNNTTPKQETPKPSIENDLNLNESPGQEQNKDSGISMFSDDDRDEYQRAELESESEYDRDSSRERDSPRCYSPRGSLESPRGRKSPARQGSLTPPVTSDIKSRLRPESKRRRSKRNTWFPGFDKKEGGEKEYAVKLMKDDCKISLTLNEDKMSLNKMSEYDFHDDDNIEEKIRPRLHKDNLLDVKSLDSGSKHDNSITAAFLHEVSPAVRSREDDKSETLENGDVLSDSNKTRRSRRKLKRGGDNQIKADLNHTPELNKDVSAPAVQLEKIVAEFDKLNREDPKGIDQETENTAPRSMPDVPVPSKSEEVIQPINPKPEAKPRRKRKSKKADVNTTAGDNASTNNVGEENIFDFAEESDNLQAEIIALAQKAAEAAEDSPEPKDKNSTKPTGMMSPPQLVVTAPSVSTTTTPASVHTSTAVSEAAKDVVIHEEPFNPELAKIKAAQEIKDQQKSEFLSNIDMIIAEVSKGNFDINSIEEVENAEKPKRRGSRSSSSKSHDSNPHHDKTPTSSAPASVIQSIPQGLASQNQLLAIQQTIPPVSPIDGNGNDRPNVKPKVSRANEYANHQFAIPDTEARHYNYPPLSKQNHQPEKTMVSPITPSTPTTGGHASYPDGTTRSPAVSTGGQPVQIKSPLEGSLHPAPAQPYRHEDLGKIHGYHGPQPMQESRGKSPTFNRQIYGGGYPVPPDMAVPLTNHERRQNEDQRNSEAERERERRPEQVRYSNANPPYQMPHRDGVFQFPPNEPNHLSIPGQDRQTKSPSGKMSPRSAAGIHMGVVQGQPYTIAQREQLQSGQVIERVPNPNALNDPNLHSPKGLQHQQPLASPDGKGHLSPGSSMGLGPKQSELRAMLNQPSRAGPGMMQQQLRPPVPQEHHRLSPSGPGTHRLPFSVQEPRNNRAEPKSVHEAHPPVAHENKVGDIGLRSPYPGMNSAFTSPDVRLGHPEARMTHPDHHPQFYHPDFAHLSPAGVQYVVPPGAIPPGINPGLLFRAPHPDFGGLVHAIPQQYALHPDNRLTPDSRPPSRPMSAHAPAPSLGPAIPGMGMRPPHEMQHPNSLVNLLEKYPMMWQGILALKNDSTAVQMHFVSGNRALVKLSMPGLLAEGVAPLRISQRMRLEPQQLNGVSKQMQSDDAYCMLLALPCGRDHMDVINQTNNLTVGFIKYLQQKQAAGIVNVPDRASQQTAYVVHIFPPCEFSQMNLARMSPDLLHCVTGGTQEIAHLLIIISTV